MRENARLTATLVIWIIFAIMTSAMLTSATGPISRAGDNAIFGIVALLAATAAFSTLVVWVGGGRGASERDRAAHLARGKRKRAGSDRIERLIADLDDDEIYDLEALLLARDQSAAREREQ
jgi:hypothetical protein